jgi:bacterioferritin-associated ferredoxin
MYVCVCLAVSDTEVRAAIEDGATTRQAVTHACGAGGDCGACHGMIEDMIEDHLECPKNAAKKLVPETALVRTRAA